MIAAPTKRSRQAAFPVPLAALVAVLLAAGCDGGWSGLLAPAPTPAPLVPSKRLIRELFLSGGAAALSGREHVSIGGVIRPTFTGARPLLFRPPCTDVPDDPEHADCELALPAGFPQASWATVEILSSADRASASDGHDADGTAPRDGSAGPGRQAVLFRPDAEPAVTVRVPKVQGQTFIARMAPELVDRTVIVPRITLPGGGVLRAWIGVEETAWDEKAAPLTFTISRIPDGATEKDVIFHREVDPFANEAQRAWIPVEIPLADGGDEPFHLVFETSPRDEKDQRVSLPVWGDPTILRPEKARKGPRRVVLISLDTLRARSMSAYGYPVATTPNFEALLRQGTIFEHAYTTYSNTLGSHMSMMTGLYPASHGVLGLQHSLDPAVPTLAGQMRDAGYETAAFTEDALLRASAGFQRGFSRYFENTEIADGAGDAEGTFRRALEWAREQPDEPLFLFVHTYEVHAPYQPPESTAESLPAPPRGADGSQHAYEREILHLDRLLAEFVDGISELGPAEDLLLVITADHGEEFFEHGSRLHLQLYDEVMHIPMFLRWPGRVPADTRVETPVSLVDIVPTVLELVGATPPPGDGVSLVPLLEGATIARDVVYGQSTRDASQQRGRRYVARTEEAKCMVRHQDDQWVRCFDLVADPQEKNPIPPDSRPEMAELRKKALAYRARDLERASEEQEQGESAPAEAELDPARREKLRMLGYVE